MAPGPGSPIVFGMQERVRRGLVQGNMYTVFFKGRKLVGEFVAVFDNTHVVIQAYIQTDNGPLKCNFVFNRRWVFELHEATALLN